MSTITKCPACGTHFRVTPEQLQARQGQVRCGRCMTVFDGVKALAAPPWPAPAAGVAAPRPPVARAADAAREKKDYGAAPQQLSLDDEYLPDEARALRGGRWWAAGAALLLFVLAGQSAYSYRSELASQYPGLRPLLVRLCDSLHCKVLPPQRPKQIAIEASDLQVADAARPGLIQLTATLRNHAGHDLAYPAVDVVLTNTKEHTLARRVFLPQEYLERGKDVAAGIPANAEITIRLDLDSGDLNPAGFRLDLLPAPQP